MLCDIAPQFGYFVTSSSYKTILVVKESHLSLVCSHHEAIAVVFDLILHVLDW